MWSTSTNKWISAPMGLYKKPVSMWAVKITESTLPTLLLAKIAFGSQELLYAATWRLGP